MIPELALEAEHVTVFQRTPQWLLPTPGYRSPFPPQVNWLDRNLPFHTNFMRFRATSAIIGCSRRSARSTPTSDDPNACQPGQQADARRLHRVPREQAGRPGAGGDDDPAAPGALGPAGDRATPSTACSTRSSATT